MQRMWPKSTMAIIAGGPSVTQMQVDMIPPNVPVIAINDAFRLRPNAEVLYGCDSKWWRWHNGVPGYAGIKIGGGFNAIRGGMHSGWDRVSGLYPDINMVAINRDAIFEDDRNILCGNNSGYQAINLAVHLGARRIVLLGYDMKGDSHWFGDHPDNVPPMVSSFKPHFAALAMRLKGMGITVFNCSPDSALDCFRKDWIVDAMRLDSMNYYIDQCRSKSGECYD